MGDDPALHWDARGPSWFFSRERNAWLAVSLYVLLLYGTLTLTYDLYMKVFNSIGEAWVRRSLYLIFAAIGALLAPALLRRLRQDLRKLVPLTLIVVVLVYVLLDIRVPANQIHFLQYAPLAYLALEALRFRVRDRQIYPLVMSLILLVSLGDELLQGALPQRRFDAHDVVLNAVAGLLLLAGWGFLGSSKPEVPFR